MRLRVEAGTNNSWVLEAATSLADWSAIGTNTPDASPFDLYDPNASDYQHRFYRLRAL